MVGGVGNKVVATLRADGKVYPAEDNCNPIENLVNYKIRTEVEMNKSLNTIGIPTTIVDLGKQLLQYARDSDVKGVRNMLARGAPFTSDWLGMTALHFAAMNNQYVICDILLKGGINKDAKTKVERTPLHYACYCGHERIVELLLSKSCCVNCKDMLRMTPLHWAVEKRFKSIVTLLLKYDADVTPMSKFGRTPVSLAVLTEQLDLIEELEAARQIQLTKKLSEAHERETSNAVNSITGIQNDEEKPSAKMEVDPEDELINANAGIFAETSMPDFDNIKETGTLDNSTVNLLKCHGISMLNDEDDNLKNLLNNALQNGRKLMLSEGGKMLLNQTKTPQNNNNINIKNNNNNTKTIAVVKSEAGQNTNRQTITINPKLKDSSIITKKGVRILSLNDFKKLYGNNPNAPSCQPISIALTNVRSKHILEDIRKNNIDQKLFFNVKQLQSRQVKKLKLDETCANGIISTESHIEEDEEPATNIIKLNPSDSDVEITEVAEPVPTPQPVRVLHTKRVEHPKPIPIRLPTTARNQVLTASRNTIEGHRPSAIVPILSQAEICRQLTELRKQNVELKRKMDLVLKENEEMRSRLDRLEQVQLVENTADLSAM
ncbi:probable serine/threonine-protein kinase tsuA isoform X2 [Teleopsis dalmanni]|uniref:probable serine/threonine-protein kinase tsuA isoform X2 n=1 Tax=Teleopsis dalmanni TaxID=139649 RepID=UPI0018CDEFA5|nr:probable serine/threonine-protein kinase tsuA isoform X2 [Teleopsis dalmanni]